VEIKESCRGCDAYIIQPICNNEDGKTVNDMLMELLIMVHVFLATPLHPSPTATPIMKMFYKTTGFSVEGSFSHANHCCHAHLWIRSPG